MAQRLRREKQQLARLCDLVGASLLPLLEPKPPRPQLTREDERRILLALSRVNKVIRGWEEEQGCEFDQEIVSCSGNVYSCCLPPDQHFDDGLSCLTNIVSILAGFLGFCSDYVKHSAGNILIAISNPLMKFIENHRAGAEIVNGDDICRKKSVELLEELGLPKGLLPLEDIEEFGYNRATGFMWLVQRKKKIEHTFKKIKQTVSYTAEVTAFAERAKLRKITGVKTKELLLWLSVVEVYVAEASPEKVTFKTGTGLSDSFDATAFAFGE